MHWYEHWPICSKSLAAVRYAEGTHAVEHDAPITCMPKSTHAHVRTHVLICHSLICTAWMGCLVLRVSSEFMAAMPFVESHPESSKMYLQMYKEWALVHTSFIHKCALTQVDEGFLTLVVLA